MVRQVRKERKGKERKRMGDGSGDGCTGREEEEEEEGGIKDMRYASKITGYAFFFRFAAKVLLLFEHYDQFNDPGLLFYANALRKGKKEKRPSHRERATEDLSYSRYIRSRPLIPPPTTSSSPHRLPHPQPLFLFPSPFPPHKPQSRPRPYAPLRSTFTTSPPLPTETPPPSPCY